MRPAHIDSNIDAGTDDGVRDGTCQDWEIEAIAN